MTKQANTTSSRTPWRWAMEAAGTCSVEAPSAAGGENVYLALIAGKGL